MLLKNRGVRQCAACTIRSHATFAQQYLLTLFKDCPGARSNLASAMQAEIAIKFGR
jgi:hypothetical protein